MYYPQIKGNLRDYIWPKGPYSKASFSGYIGQKTFQCLTFNVSD